jgi:hypothetical protein
MDKFTRAGAVALASVVILGTAGFAVANVGGDDTAVDTTPVTSTTPTPSASPTSTDDHGGLRDRGVSDDPAGHDANDDSGHGRHHGSGDDSDDSGHHGSGDDSDGSGHGSDGGDDDHSGRDHPEDD